MTKILLIPHGWLGDRLFTTSVATVLKRYMPYVEIHYVLNNGFEYMKRTIESLSSVDVVTQNPEALDQYDYHFVMPHTDHAESPIKTYCRTVFEDDVVESMNLTPELISKQFLASVATRELPEGPYLTYQRDWQDRTFVNVDTIIRQLTVAGVQCVGIGKDMGLSNQGNPLANEQLFHNTLHLIANAKYHLSMLGGTAMMATYVGTPTITTMDWYFHRHNPTNLPEPEFMKWWGLTPYSISGDQRHHLFSPTVTEDQIVQHVLEKMKND